MTILFGCIGLCVFGVLAGLLFYSIDRILVARMQARIGPPWQQPFYDVGKLMTKENVVPENAVTWLFNLAPVIALASSLGLLFYVPISSFAPLLGAHGDLILIVYLLAVPALAMVIGGFASSSPYATIGAQREMVTMMSYELPLATIAIAFAWNLQAAGVEQPFSMAVIAENPIWQHVGPIGLAGCILLFITLLLVTPGELSRIPFDTPEAETELAGGLLVEYSGRNLALFYMALGVKAIAMASIVIVLFFPYGISDMFAVSGVGGHILDFLFYLVKLEVVIFVAASLIRIAMARLRINQVVTLYWKYLGVIGGIGLILLMIDASL